MSTKLSILEPCFVDSFAGGGGASTGIELATGHPVDIAINHNESAIMMHQRNHPYTRHYKEDVWAIDPKEVTAGRKVRIAWFSPDCKHFSRAKGAALVDKHIRGLAWIVLRWAGTVRPDVIMLENVPEFVTWGPVRKGKPVKKKAGQTYRKWYAQLEALGYQIETRVLCAADYGAPTIRTRFCLIARCDGSPIVFPERTHAPKDSEEVKSGKCLPWRSAAEIIDFSLPTYSIFETSKTIKEQYGVNVRRPLRPNTLQRIAKGLDKFVINSKEPFIIQCNHSGAGHINSIDRPINTVTVKDTSGIILPALTQYHGGRNGKEDARGQELNKPIQTIDTGNRYGLQTAHLTQYFSGEGHYHSVDEPLATITTLEREAVTSAKLTEYNAVHLAHFKGKDKGQNVSDPLMSLTSREAFGTIVTKIVKWDGETNPGHWNEVRQLLNNYCEYKIPEDEILLFYINNAWYFISDIGLRMLIPRELYNAMGFPFDYIIDVDAYGNKISREDQVARCGNAVCPPLAEALVRANLEECKQNDKLKSMHELHGVMCS